LVTTGANDETLRLDSASFRVGVGRPLPSLDVPLPSLVVMGKL
jgi:hypothetical protein